MEFVTRMLDWWKMRQHVRRLDRLIEQCEREDPVLRARIDRKKFPLLIKFMDKTDQLPQLRAMRDIAAQAARSWAPWR